MFGALFGAAVVSLIPKVQRSYEVRLMAMAVGLAMATGYAVGRMGCFLVGDDYGKVTDLPWGIAFPKGSPPIDVPVHPTQLYEILGSLVIFALLWWVIQPHVKREGVMFFVYLILAGIERFLVEFVRTNPAVALGLTQQQWISIALFVVLGIAGIWWFAKRGRPLTLLSTAKGKGGAAAAKAGGAQEKATAKPAPRPSKPAAAPTRPPRSRVSRQARWVRGQVRSRASSRLLKPSHAHRGVGRSSCPWLAAVLVAALVGHVRGLSARRAAPSGAQDRARLLGPPA